MSSHPRAIAFENVCKGFGEKQVLDNISFEVAAGEAVCILGKSGTGKSVTLKLLIALLRADRGKIWIEEDELSQISAKELSRVRRKIGYLFQDAALFDSFTLFDNLMLPLLRFSGKSVEEAASVADALLTQVGLLDDKRKRPAELSGGMRKRAGLARALVLDPKILLADEPSSGLDRVTAAEIDELLLDRKQKSGTTLVVVTHDVHGARRVGDRFVVLDQSKLVAHGTLEEVEQSEHDVARRLISER